MDEVTETTATGTSGFLFRFPFVFLCTDWLHCTARQSDFSLTSTTDFSCSCFMYFKMSVLFRVLWVKREILSVLYFFLSPLSTADLLAMRVAVVGTCIVSVLSILVLIPGLRCTTLIPSVQAQGRLLQISGALCLCGGLYCSASP